MASQKHQSQPSQADRFIKAARQVGADEDEATFKAKLAAVARHKPKGEVPEPPEGEKVP